MVEGNNIVTSFAYVQCKSLSSFFEGGSDVIFQNIRLKFFSYFLFFTIQNVYLSRRSELNSLKCWKKLPQISTDFPPPFLVRIYGFSSFSDRQLWHHLTSEQIMQPSIHTPNIPISYTLWNAMISLWATVFELNILNWKNTEWNTI